MGESVQVMVVASDSLLEAGVTSAVESCEGITMAPAGEAAPVTLLAVDGVDHPALDLVRSVRAEDHRPGVVLTATDLVVSDARQAIAAGARGLLRRREAEPNRLARTVLAVAMGDCMVPPDLLQQLLEAPADAGCGATPGDRMADGSGGEASFAEWTGTGLTDRERAVLALIADGRETDEIAKELCYSPRTVTSVVHDITHRFRLRNRAHAVAYAVRTGLL